MVLVGEIVGVGVGFKNIIIVLLIPFMDGCDASVTIIVCACGFDVPNVTLKVLMPASDNVNAESTGSMASGSDEVKCTVPV